MFTHLLVATDGSVLSKSDVLLTVSLASENMAKMTALHVIPEFHFLRTARKCLQTLRTDFFRSPSSTRMTTSER
jgi:nucleotide-binding universal stress UspA family protein